VGERPAVARLRRSVALVVALLAAALAVAGVVAPQELSCSVTTVEERSTEQPTSGERDERGAGGRRVERSSTEPRDAATTTTTSTCSGVNASQLLPLAVLVALLLLPDMSELAIPGLITLRRRVEQQEQAVSSQAARQSDLEHRLQALQTTVQSTNMSVYVLNNLDAIAQDVERKAPIFLDPQALMSTPTEAPSPDPATAVRVHELLDLAERLSTYDTALSEGSLSPESQEAVRRWSHLFATELAAVRTARNRVAHPPHDLSPRQIEDAVRIARRLYELLQSAIENPPT
jgi:hypothetical protein